ncbi:MAG: YceI family protein [Pseudomonadota bacterium]|nr:YceI family protein [Pseudomonadota bacterium]
MSLNRRLAFAALAATLIAGPALAQGAPKVVTDPKAAPAGVYKLDPKHASATIKVAHMGLSRYTMHFAALSGEFNYDPAHPTATKVHIAIDPNSIETGDAAFNKEIAEQFLDTGKFATLTFDSTKITEAKDGHGVVDGVLDFHGVKKPVALHVTYRGYVEAMGQKRMGFSGETTFKRSEFGASKYVPLVGDEVELLIEVEFAKQ